jgi:uncharacterized membrane protein
MKAGPSVELRWRTLRRAVWALLRRAVLAAVDYVGALTLIAIATGKFFAIDLACVPTLHRQHRGVLTRFCVTDMTTRSVCCSGCSLQPALASPRCRGRGAR